jgi:hypothetical protein
MVMRDCRPTEKDVVWVHDYHLMLLPSKVSTSAPHTFAWLGFLNRRVSVACHARSRPTRSACSGRGGRTSSTSCISPSPPRRSSGPCTAARSSYTYVP